MRQGGIATKLTISGNQIVAGANAVTAVNGVVLVGHATMQDPDYRLVSTGAGNGPISVNGTIQGIAGTLTGSASGGPPSTALQYTFTPATDPGTVNCPAGSAFTISVEAPGSIAVIWAGRNNYFYPSEVIADIAKMVAALPDGKFVVLSILNGDFNNGETNGLANWTTITGLNASLKAAYPNNYIDIRSILVAKGAPGSQYANASDYANDLVPTGLRGDQLHLNDAGNGIVAATVADFITKAGW
jgi:hypothetical protein